MTPEEIKISKGASFRLFYLGMALFIAGLLLASLLNMFAGGPLLLFAVPLILSWEGVIIDLRNRRIKEYFDYGLFKGGSWQNLSEFSSLTLERYASTTRENRGKIMGTTVMKNPLTGSPHVIQTRSYSIYLVSENGQRMELKEFTDYKMAKTFADTLSTRLQFPLDDQAGAQQASALRRRHKREGR